MLTNQPASLGKVTAFQESPFPIEIQMPDGYVIDEPVTVEIWTYGTMVDDTTPVTVDGQNISFTFEPEQLREFAETKFFVLFDGVILMGATVVTTLDPAYPTGTTIEVQLPGAPDIIKVSVWSDRESALLAQQAAAQAEAARDETIEAMVEVSDRVPKFLDDLAAKIMLDRDTEYTDVSGALSDSGGATGTTVNTGTKAITITSGNSGTGAFMRQAFDLSVFDQVRITDKINILVRLTETISGTITSSTLGVRLYINGVLSGVTSTAPALYDAATKTWQITMQPTVGAVTDEYEVEVYIKAGAPVQAATTVITWIELGANQDKYVFEDAVDYIDSSLRALDGIRVTFDDQPVVTAIDMTGLTDVTVALQAEIDKAIGSSGKWVGRAGTPMITDRLLLTGRIQLDLNGMDVNAAIPTVGREVFNIATASPVYILNGTFRRLAGNPSHQPTFCKFESAYTNKESVFSGVTVVSFPQAMDIDYVDGMTVQDCQFSSGQFNAVRIGNVAAASTKNVKMRRNKMDSYLGSSVLVKSLEGFSFDDNRIYSTSLSTFTNIGLELAPATGNFKNVRIANNIFDAFRTYGISVVIPSGVTLDGINMFRNWLYDLTPDVTDASSRPIYVDGVSKNISNLGILQNDIFTKEIGIWVDNATFVKVQGNTIRKNPGTYAASQGMLMANVDYLLGNNIIDPGLAVATVPGGWSSSTAYTAV